MAGLSVLQFGALRTLALACLLTRPVAILLAGTLHVPFFKPF